jgi:hypothetical protein
MNSQSDKTRSKEKTDPGTVGTAVDRPGLSDLTLWIAAGVAMVLAIVAISLRLSTSLPQPIHWAAVELSEQSALRSTQLPEAADPAVRLVDLPAHSLASLGTKLDDPAFGRLGEKRRAAAERVIPIDRRWQIAFAPGLSERQYAQQLVALGAELGILTADGKLRYVVGIGQAGTKQRSGSRQEEKRPYWTWQRGDLTHADQVLLKNAGLPVDDEIILHFLSDETITAFEKLEHDFQGRDAEDILLTRFALKRTFRGYEPYVQHQVER